MQPSGAPPWEIFRKCTACAVYLGGWDGSTENGYCANANQVLRIRYSPTGGSTIADQAGWFVVPRLIGADDATAG